METKGEIEARLDELNMIATIKGSTLDRTLRERREELTKQLGTSEEDIFRSVVRSHGVLCKVKQMDPKAAYGQHPMLYYGAAVAGEAGEMCNKIVKALRNGNDHAACLSAVVSELPDVIIYSAVLAHVTDIDLTHLVNGKVDVVIERALSGYYGGPLPESVR